MKARRINNKVLIYLSITLSLIYLFIRIFYTLPIGYGAASMTFAVILLFAEVSGIIESIMNLYGMSKVVSPKIPDVNEDKFPDVDVFIATYNEPVELLYNTINGCLNMDYPDKDKVHIYLCDDTSREEMKKLAKHMNINYITRKERKDAKAGNYNNAMKNSSSPLIVTFDADMIPMSDFLMSTVPYFLGEEEIGFIQTPQSFYNPDLFQFNLFLENAIPNEQDYFFRKIEVAKNKTNTCIYGGSNTVISRKALEDVGGFYTKVITEDFATGILIQSKGYRCYAIGDVHASGLSPSDIKSLVKQRERWGRGCIQTFRKLGILRMKGLSLLQKISCLTSIFYWYSSIRRAIYIIAPLLFTFFGVVVVKCQTFFVFWLWFINHMVNRVLIYRISDGIRSTKWTNIYETILFPSLMLTMFMETFGITQNKFEVTRKDKIKENKLYNLKKAVPHIIFAILSIISLYICVDNLIFDNNNNILINIFWLMYNLFTLIMAILFMAGRTAYRRYERVNIITDAEVKIDDKIIKCKTKDISESGISLTIYEEMDIKEKENIIVIVRTDKYTSEFEVKLIRKQGSNNDFSYAFIIDKISEDNYRSLLNIIYDRVPTLPDKIEKEKLSVYYLGLNINKRIKKYIMR